MLRKRILYCEGNTDSSVGGSHFSLFYLVEALDKSRYDPVVVFHRENRLIPMYREAGLDTRVFTIRQPFRFPAKALNIPVLKGLLRLLQAMANLWRMVLIPAIRCALYLRANRIDLVHLNNTIIRNHHWMLGATLAGAKCISHERGINERISRFSHLMTKRLAGIICISRAVRDNLVREGIDEDKLVVVHNALEVSRVLIKADPLEIRRRHRIDPASLVIGMVGNIKEWKGQDVVIRATARLRERWPGLRCLLVGDTALEDKYFEDRIRILVNELGVDANIIFTGYQASVADYMNAMDVVIHASITPEPFGRVLLEAMALKKPLIGANAGAVPEIIQHGETGMLSSPGDDQMLARYIEELLQNPSHARAMGEKGYQRLIQEFGIKSNVLGTQALYERIFSGTIEPANVGRH